MCCSGPCGPASGVPSPLESRKDEAQVIWKPPWSGRVRPRARPGELGRGAYVQPVWGSSSRSNANLKSPSRTKTSLSRHGSFSVRTHPETPRLLSEALRDPVGWERCGSRWQTPRHSTQKSRRGPWGRPRHWRVRNSQCKNNPSGL